MEIEELKQLADSFFEWPTEDRTQVTLTSALMFAQHVLRVIQQQAEPQRVTMAHMDALHKAIDHVAALQNNRLRFQSACEISGEKHPEYVRGYEAAMDAKYSQLLAWLEIWVTARECGMSFTEAQRMADDLWQKLPATDHVKSISDKPLAVPSV